MEHSKTAATQSDENENTSDDGVVLSSFNSSPLENARPADRYIKQCKSIFTLDTRIIHGCWTSLYNVQVWFVCVCFDDDARRNSWPASLMAVGSFVWGSNPLNHFAWCTNVDVATTTATRRFTLLHFATAIVHCVCHPTASHPLVLLTTTGRMLAATRTAHNPNIGHKHKKNIIVAYNFHGSNVWRTAIGIVHAIACSCNDNKQNCDCAPNSCLHTHATCKICHCKCTRLDGSGCGRIIEWKISKMI